MRKYTAETQVSAFWSKVDCTAGLFKCWLWTAGGIKGGYGMMTWNGKLILAHRISYELANGPFPKELCVCHSCDNPPCVNPAHLFLGTNQDNVDDKNRKGRGVYLTGEKHGSCKYSDTLIAEVRFQHEQGMGPMELVRKYGISHTHICRILANKQRR